MYKIHNFDNWQEDSDRGKFGSGASEKIWLMEPLTNKTGLFKYPKIKDEECNIVTGEYWAEKLACELAKLLKINCSEVEIGYYKGRIGSMSYNFTEGIKVLIEGVSFIEKKYPNYNKDKFIDETSQKKYSLQMIEECLPQYLQSTLLMILFDALIGNSDRHHSNWGIVFALDDKKGMYDYFSPLYDNGSSLCAYVNDEDINKLFKDKMMYNALLDTKSKSTIGWDNQRPIRHFELVENIKNNYYKETIRYVENIKNEITIDKITTILNNFDDTIISKEKKSLIIKFIIDRRNKILEIYNMED